MVIQDERLSSSEALAAAAAHLQAGRLAEAEAGARQALHAAPDHPDALHLLGVATARAGRPDAAVPFLERAIARHGENPNFHFNLGSVLEALGRLNEAAAAYQGGLAIDPKAAAGHYNLGGVFQDLERFSEAAAAYRRAIEIRPEIAEAHFNLGGALRALGHLAEAEQAYRRAIELKPNMAEAHSNLGPVLQELGRFDEATASLKRATEINPAFAGAYSNLGSVLREMERFEESAAAYRRAIELAPDMPDLHTNLGAVLRALDDLDGAVAAHRRAIGIWPNFVEAHINLGIALLQNGDPAAVLETCDAYLAHEPDNARALSLKAVALDELGRRAEARGLVDFDRLIQPIHLDTPPGFGNMAEFNVALSDHILNHPSLVFAPTSHATRNGRHTGELLVEPKGPMAALEQLLNGAIETYIRDHAADPDHPFLANPPKRWKLTVWSVVMGRQGHQVPHIHPAWLSGCYYPKLPDVVAASQEDHAGWIEFGRPGLQVPYTVEPEIRAYQPEEGLVVLFPSYFYHHTVPYASDQERISIAFDVLRQD